MTSTEMPLKWEWEHRKNHWVRYDDAVGTSLSKTYNSDTETSPNAFIKIETGDGQSISFNPSKMTVKSAETGFERAVRCVIAASKSEQDVSTFNSWQWQDEQQRWHSYKPEHVEYLERAHQADATNTNVNLTLNHQSYTVDLTNMTQTNDVTHVARTIRRVTSDASIVARQPSVRNTRSNSRNTDQPVPDKKPSKRPASNQENRPDEESEARPKVKKSRKSSTESQDQKPSTSKKSTASSAANNETKSVKRKVLVKGLAPVDNECTQKIHTAHVYVEGHDIYDAMLNQTNIANNNNKYYLLQLLEDDNAKSYSVWFRWGRVGYKGQTNLIACGPDLNEAKRLFCQKFSDKTHNDWGDRKKFKKTAGKYDLVQMDYGTKPETKQPDTKQAKSESKKEDVPDSKLDVRIQALLQLICDIRSMEQTLVELEYDAARAPLGKLTKQQVKNGYKALKRIEQLIEARKYGGELVQACSDYYTRVPHYFGMRQPPLIKTTDAVARELELLETLEDIEVAIRTLQSAAGQSDLNPIDQRYAAMKCELTPMDETDPDYKAIEEALQTTHAPTHIMYKMKLRNVYIAKQLDHEFDESIDNRLLLWHGSRTSNWYSILSRGLQVAPPEAPVTGYMFGKGIYFADMASKSANYCMANRQKNVGLVTLSEVALGRSNELYAADYHADRLPSGCQSTKGLGENIPDPNGMKTLSDGSRLPCGKCVSSGVSAKHSGYTLQYNEFVVYNPKQVRMRYLLEVEFAFN